MDFLKGIGKFFLSVITFVLVIVLTITIYVGNVLLISENYFKEDTIKKIVSSVNIVDLLKDEDGVEIPPVTELKNELVNAGIPVEVFDKIVESDEIQTMMSSLLLTTTDYIIYDKEFNIPKINSDQIYVFVEDNIDDVVRIMQENNVPDSELLTEEKQTQILSTLKTELPVIEEDINEMLKEVEIEIKSLDEYQKAQDYKNKLDNGLAIVRFIYSDTVKLILISIIIVLVLLIMLTRRSIYKSLKWIGFSLLLAGGLMYMSGFLLPYVKEMFISDIPYVFVNLINTIFDNMDSLFIRNSMICLPIGLVLIVLNIIIYSIKEKNENKEFEI